MKVVVVGAGPSGLCSALVLSRAGHEVVLLERDSLDQDSDVEALGWHRPGVPQFGQPHGFIARGRLELRAELPDVYQELLGAGALEIRPGDHVPQPSEPLPDDADLTYLAVRRPMIEWALRRALRRDRLVKVLDTVQATQLVVASGDPLRVTGIATSAGAQRADLVVDAGGRRSPIPGWLRDHGVSLPAESSEVGYLYYSRYFRLRPGCRLPELGASLGPRADFGFCGFVCFIGDRDTFAFVLRVPTDEPQLRVLRHAPAFEAFCAEVPKLQEWVNPQQAEPITDVLPMGSLQNTLVNWRSQGNPAAVGLLPASDAWIHTDPGLALGLCNGIIHARVLAAALETHRDWIDVAECYFDSVEREARERYDLATALAEGRERSRRGELSVDRHRNLPLFLSLAGGAAASRDPEIFRRVWRRNGYLDSTEVMEDDQPLLDRIERIVAENPAPPAPVLEKESLLERLNRAVVG